MHGAQKNMFLRDDVLPYLDPLSVEDAARDGEVHEDLLRQIIDKVSTALW